MRRPAARSLRALNPSPSKTKAAPGVEAGFGPVERTLNVSYSKKDPVEAEAEGTLLI
jgi:hypothetical protein